MVRHAAPGVVIAALEIRDLKLVLRPPQMSGYLHKLFIPSYTVPLIERGI